MTTRTSVFRETGCATSIASPTFSSPLNNVPAPCTVVPLVTIFPLPGVRVGAAATGTSTGSAETALATGPLAAASRVRFKPAVLGAGARGALVATATRGAPCALRERHGTVDPWSRIAGGAQLKTHVLSLSFPGTTCRRAAIQKVGQFIKKMEVQSCRKNAILVSVFQERVQANEEAIMGLRSLAASGKAHSWLACLLYFGPHSSDAHRMC